VFDPKSYKEEGSLHIDNLQNKQLLYQRTLTSDSLEIYGCSELKERCKVNTGDDWPKIAHIQSIEVRSFPVYIGERECALTVDLL
jgi:hypothetical protein